MKDDAIRPDTKFVGWHVVQFRRVGCDGMFLIRLGRSMCNKRLPSLLPGCQCCCRGVGLLCSVAMVVLLMALLTSCCFVMVLTWRKTKDLDFNGKELVFVSAGEAKRDNDVLLCT